MFPQPFSFLKSAAVGTSYTLFYDSITTQTGPWPFGNNAFDDRHYGGINSWLDASARKIGRVTFKLSLNTGSIAGKSFTCKIWTLTGVNLNAVQATSTAVVGSDAWASTLVNFDFPSPFTTTGSTLYAITIDGGAVDSANYANGYHTTPQVESGNLTVWAINGVPNETYVGTYNMQLRMYTVP